MRHRIYCHLVWTTRARAPLIGAESALFLCGFLRTVARDERALILEVGLVSDHAHLLVRLHPGTDLPRLVQRLKGSSAAVWGKAHRNRAGQELRWSKGYSVQSVSPRQVAAVRDYLRRQPAHHPASAIPGWPGDRPQYDGVAPDQWKGPDRWRLR